MKTLHVLLSIGLVLVISFILAESLVRISGKAQSWSEQNGLGYVSPYQQTSNSWYYLRKPGIYNDVRKEFNYILNINSEGFRDTTNSLIKDAGTIRIVGLGDSFTEGFGAPLDSCWLFLLTAMLNLESQNKYEPINAGLSGSDPFYNYLLLKDKLLKYKPDIVILTLNKTDFDDYVCRGGFERFAPNGSIIPVKPPVSELIFKRSHLIRLIMIKIFGYDWQLLNNSARQRYQQKYVSAISKLITEYKKTCVNNNCKFYVLIHPLKDELVEGKYFFDAQALSNVITDQHIQVVDMLPVFTNYISTHDVNHVYWPIDKHNTSTGYYLFAKELYSVVKVNK